MGRNLFMDVEGLQHQNVDTTILVPKDSFIAFRLQYATPEDIAASSRLLFLGQVDERWKPTKKSAILTKNSKKDRSLSQLYDAADFFSTNGFRHQLSSTSAVVDRFARRMKAEVYGARSSHCSSSVDSQSKKTVLNLETQSVVSAETINGRLKSTQRKLKFANPDEGKKKKELRRQQREIQRRQVASQYGKIKSKKQENTDKEPKCTKFVARQISPEPFVEGFVDSHEPLEKKSKKHKRDIVISHSKALKSKTTTKARALRDDLYYQRVDLLRKVLGRFKSGELVKVEKMLVMVKLLPKVQLVNALNESTPHESRTLERWKEYFVVVRSTGDVELPLLFQFYTSRQIKKIEGDDKSKQKEERTRSKLLDFLLDIKTCSVSFYNSLDKSVALSVPWEKGDRGVLVYIFKTASQYQSHNWYFFIHTSLGLKTHDVIKVSIPDVNLELDVAIPLDEYEEIIDDERSTSHLSVTYSKVGYKINNCTSISFIIESVINKLKEVSHEFPNAVPWLNKAQSNKYMLALAWKSYDRLEWVAEYSQNILCQYQVMKNTHSLELRFACQSPTCTISLTGDIIHEPVPVEGFLRKLTGRRGEKYGPFGKQNKFLKYFFTSKQLLCFCSKNCALPPIIWPGNQNLHTAPSIDQLKSYAANLPHKCELINFDIDENHHFDWLRPGISSEELHWRDSLCFLAIKRLSYHILQSEGIINMCDIQKICPLEDIDTSCLMRKDRFVIIMKNQSTTILEACDEETRDEWIRHLTQLSSYWKLRKTEDTSRLMFIKETNLAKLSITEYVEAAFVDKAAKWELQKGLGDPIVFNMNSLSVLQIIIMSGELYFKPRKHSTFQKYYVVLVPGFLLLYSLFWRNSLTNGSTPSTYYKHHSSIPLNSCYLYSGKLLASDLLHRDRNFDIMNPGHHALPRVYLDGWKSCEDEPTRCFAIWIGTKRLITRSTKSKKQGSGGITGIISADPNNEVPDKSAGAFRNKSKSVKSVNRLGAIGRTMVFMARSRQEKDLWAVNISNEIGRFNYEDVSEEVDIF